MQINYILINGKLLRKIFFFIIKKFKKLKLIFDIF